MAGILKPEEEELIKAAGSIIKAVGYKYSAAVGTVITAAEKAATVHKIVNITSRFCHKLNSKLAVIGDKLPSNAEMFKLYTQYFLTAEDSQAVYNKLISTGILNDAGEVIEQDRGKIVTKIRALDLERNDQFKNKVIIFCFKLQDLEGKNKQETRDRIAFNAEQMITNRIMQLVKAEVLSPAVGTVMGSGVNAITDKLRQASELSKHRVKQEMQKHYHKVTLTVDDPNPNTETPVDQPKIENPFRYLNLKKLASTASFCSPLSPEMLEALRNPKAAAEAAAAKQKALDDWYEDPRIKCHLPYERYTSMFMSDANAAVKQKALDAWYEDPRIKCHLPYERYTSMFMSHSNTATTANTSTKDTSSTADNSATAKDAELPSTSRDIAVPTTSSVQVKLSSIGNVEASTSGTAQATEISLPVLEAMALKYGPKTARVFAKFGLKYGMKLIPGVGLAATAYDAYNIASPTIRDMYNSWFATKPNEDSSTVVEKITNEASYGPNECLLPLRKNRHEVEDPIEKLLSVIASTQPETIEQSVKIWEIDDKNTVSCYHIEKDKKVDALTAPDYNLLDKLEKRRHDDKKKSSATADEKQKASTSTSFMPDPDDFEPDEKDKFKQHESGRYECAKAESPEWSKGKPFKSEFRSNGLSGKKKEYYRWDHYHKDIEVYDHDARYIGSKDPVTGKIYRKGNMKRNEQLKGITK